ncbi:aminodeoxychorismate lyase [Hafnia alvei]|uniref:Aminodeoxychorismate lyase n=1 Tax=Hafnia alvei TaxID=569 RepID=A0A1C6Z0Z1_HAFAL|nr:aminodeoxychorismate lyase [Hafnia alvei]NLS53945.1 aminodeoxychorismate lyase [Hafnia alvei]SCM52691.1 4-amino-4-deoxychorismate lyase [Hafnia alvei]
MFWLNGTPAEVISLGDRGLHYGDGCFTTARSVQGRIDDIHAHLRRMQSACSRLFIEPVDWTAWLAEFRQAAIETGNGVVKAIITRGSGGRGYSISAVENPRRIFSNGAIPAQYAQWQEDGITLAVSPIRLGINPSLAGIKHLNRLEQVLIKAKLEQTKAHEALVLDSEARLVECCAANLFWRIGQQVFTPTLANAGVDGLMRQRIVRILAESEYELSIVSASLDALQDAEEVFICNSLMPLLPVNKAGEYRFSSRQLADYLLPQCLLPVYES